MRTFLVTFDDGSVERVSADDSGQAKHQAKTKRVMEVDPLQQLPMADRTRHPRIKVRSVKEADRARAQTGLV